LNLLHSTTYVIADGESNKIGYWYTTGSWKSKRIGRFIWSVVMSVHLCSLVDRIRPTSSYIFST